MADIVIDAMGGDQAPYAEVKGAVAFLGEETGTGLLLVGDQDKIEKELQNYPISSECRKRVDIFHTEETITMEDSPIDVLRKKKNSSLAVAARLVSEGKGQALVTAGNTGASMVACKKHFKVIGGVDRPAIATVFPGKNGQPVILLDMGANVDCKPLNLVQFAILGTAYSAGVFQTENPRVGLLNIGEEKGKGNEQTRQAYELFSEAPVNFVGNVEGRDIISGEVDVIVCDGFIGNILLKFGESVGSMLMELLKRELTSRLHYKLAAMVLRPAFLEIKKKLDYAEYGGAPLLGLNNVCIICHGSSNSMAVKNAIHFAKNFVKGDVNSRVTKLLSDFIDQKRGEI